MLEVFVLIAIGLTLIPGITFFVRHRQHRELMRKAEEISEKVNEWRHKDFEKAQEYAKQRTPIHNKIFQYQNEMATANYFLAAGACSFAIIELYKMVLHFFCNP